MMAEANKESGSYYSSIDPSAPAPTSSALFAASSYPYYMELKHQVILP